MRFLLDTHALVWSVTNPEKLSSQILRAMSAEDAVVFVSVVSAWEIAIKVGKGIWPDARSLLETFDEKIDASGFHLQAITVPHVRLAGLMPSPHRDPFDRLLAAQAAIEGLTLVSSDAKMAGLGADVIW